ncbi:MAG: DNA (cytosine-5-)-methyltransferase [Shewanella psychromarinicola]|uniref:DNA cytosine methyltransferase n=1 Tax=Shewanella psychromarinicola TaxID=2487742 RepID=UPI0030024B49
MFDVHEKLEDHFSLEVLADILSLPKRSIESRIKKGELELCPKTGLINMAQVIHFPEVKRIHESRWDEELTIKPNRPYKLIELFAGGGGLALGMEQAGFESVLLNEMDKHACSTLRHNRPDWNVVEGDISKVDFTKIKEVDVLTGGFPCQAFSYAGKSLGFEDTRGTLFFEMARAIKETNPKVIMAENVRALLTHENGRTLETIKNVIDELGYVLVEPKVIKAIFYKVPQKRERLILVGIRKDLAEKAKFTWPSPYKRVMTLTDAFKKGELFETDVEASPGQKYPKRKEEIMNMVPQGGYWRDIKDIDVRKEYMQKSFYLGGGKTGMARRLSMDEPSLTLTTSPAQKQTERCHPIETRPLQSKEYARIQTFPDNWEFQGPLTAIYKQIGNAVPVNMAAALGRSLVRLLNNIEA